MKKTVEQIVYERRSRKISKLTEIQRYYGTIKNRKTVLLDEQINKKVELVFKRRETKRDRKTDQMVKNTEREKDGKKTIIYVRKAKPITKGMMLKVLQKYVRLRDSGPDGYGYCISSGARVYYKEADGGHYISALFNPTAFDLDNIHLQSKGDNMAMSGAFGIDKAKEVEAKYRENLIKKIGIQRVIELEINKSTLVDIRQYLTHDVYEYWKAKVDELERTKTLSS